MAKRRNQRSSCTKENFGDLKFITITRHDEKESISRSCGFGFLLRKDNVSRFLIVIDWIREFYEKSKAKINLRFHNSLENPTFKMLLSRLYLYSAASTTEVNEFGKPIQDKWTLHRVIAEVQGITLLLMTNERVFILSLLALLLYYTIASLIYYLQLGDENDYFNIWRDLEYLQIQKEILKLRRVSFQNHSISLNLAWTWIGKAGILIILKESILKLREMIDWNFF